MSWMVRPGTMPQMASLAPISYAPMEANPLTTVERFFQLPIENPLRHTRLEQFPPEMRQKCYDVELRHENMKNLKFHIQSQIKTLDDGLDQLRLHATECSRLAGNVSSHQGRMKSLIELIREDNHENIALFEKAQKQWQLLKTDYNAIIEVPSPIFVDLAVSLESRLEKYKERIAEIQELVYIQMQAKEAEVEASSDILVEIIQNMQDNFVVIAGSVCELREIIDGLKVRFLELAKSKTGRSKNELSMIFKLPEPEITFPEFQPSSLGTGHYSTAPQPSNLFGKSDVDHFYQGLLGTPKLM